MEPRPSRLIAFLLLCASVPVAQDVRLESMPTRWRLGGTYFRAENDAEVGLLGVHYDALSPWLRFPELYVGLGGFASIAGDRGGIFVGGVTLGWLQAVSAAWSLEAGLFAGAGGGGDGPVSEGLVLRPHLAVERNVGLIALRLELAYVDFIDDPIDDFHLALGVSLPSELLSASASKRRQAIPPEALTERRIRVSPLVQLVDPGDDVRTTKGRAVPDDLALVGAGFDYFLSPTVFVPIEAMGAVDGSSDGFATAFTGLGWSLPFVGEHVQLELRALVGAGGGGEVDVGGGLLWQARGGLRARLYGPLSLHLGLGYLDAPDGSFEGSVLTGGLTWSTVVPELGLGYPRQRLDHEGLPEARARIETTRLQLLNKTYTPRSEFTTKSGLPYDTAINLLGVGLEQPVLGDFSVLARAYGAWEGDIGGYAEGLFGAKYDLTPLEDERHHFTISMEAGAGGGGGVDLGSGGILQFLAGWRFELTRSASLSAEFGSMRSRHGVFSAETFQVGLVWNLNRAELR